jgi:hypothetical protein
MRPGPNIVPGAPPGQRGLERLLVLHKRAQRVPDIAAALPRRKLPTLGLVLYLGLRWNRTTLSSAGQERVGRS